MTEAWIAGDPAGWWADEWVFDCGEYLGPGDYAPPPFLPASADLVAFTLGFPNPDNDIQHFNDGSYTSDWRNKYRTTGGSTGTTGSAFGGTGGRHLYAVWVPAGSPSDLTGTDPDILPLDLVPAAYVVGGRYVTPVDGTASFAFGGLTVTADTTPTTVTGAAAFTFGKLTVTATAGRPAMALYDTDGTTWLANLPNATGIRWQWVLNAPGSLTCNLPMDDASTALATPGRFLKVSWRGRTRMAARIADTTTEAAVDGRQWLEFNQLPGALNLLGDGVVYPEHGLGRASSSQRTFGYMARGGFWTASGNYSVPEAIRWSDMTGVRAGQPEGLDFPNPYWIAKRSPHFFEPIGATQYFRRAWTTYTDNIPYQILATADNYLTLWLDGEQLFATDLQSGLGWNQLQQITGNLDAGEHVLAAKVVNGGRASSGSPLAFIMTLQQTKDDGTVVDGPPLINTNLAWHVADNVPGFQRADVLVRLYGEARDRNVDGFLVLTRGFGTETDTRGDAWTETPGEFTLDVGSSVLDAQAQLCETGMNVWVDPELMDLQAFLRQGTDRSGSVSLAFGADGGAIMSHRIDSTAAKTNTALMQLGDGSWVERANTASVAAHGRREIGLSMGSTTDVGSAQKVADAQFADTANPSASFQTELVDGRGPAVYLDWFEGDSVNVPDGFGGGAKVRCISLDIDASDDKAVYVTPEWKVDPT